MEGSSRTAATLASVKATMARAVPSARGGLSFFSEQRCLAGAGLPGNPAARERKKRKADAATPLVMNFDDDSWLSEPGRARGLIFFGLASFQPRHIGTCERYLMPPPGNSVFDPAAPIRKPSAASTPRFSCLRMKRTCPSGGCGSRAGGRWRFRHRRGCIIAWRRTSWIPTVSGGTIRGVAHGNAQQALLLEPQQPAS